MGAKLAALIERVKSQTGVEAGDVLDIAPNGGAVGYGSFVEIAARADLVRTERGVARRSDFEGFELDDLVAQNEADFFRAIERKINILAGAGAQGLRLRGNRVGAADAETREVELAVEAGDGGRACARLLVKHRDSGSGDRFAQLVCDEAVDRGSRDALREHAREHGQR